MEELLCLRLGGFRFETQLFFVRGGGGKFEATVFEPPPP